MMSKKILGLAMVVGLLSRAALAGVAGIWIGEQSKDPVTDKPYALAMTYDVSNQGFLSLRCKNGTMSIFVRTNEEMFKVGDRPDVVLRFGTEAPISVQAIAGEPTLLALKSDVATITPFLRAGAFVVRFSGPYGREQTMRFESALLPNSLTIVGRVLAACDVAPFPEAEIAKATDDLMKRAAGDDKPVSKKGRSRSPK
jgi:hypothetical protein